ncbi:MAG: DUF6152 family protein [Bryobacteraceae bacterium]
MKRISGISALLGFLLGAPLVAHHGTFSDYLADKLLTMKGVVTEFQFVNPHVQVFFTVTAEDGSVVRWGAEMVETPGILKKRNPFWSREAVKPGDRIEIVCNAPRDPAARICRAQEFTIDGKRMY